MSYGRGSWVPSRGSWVVGTKSWVIIKKLLMIINVIDKLLILFKLLENHTLHSGTYPYSLNMEYLSQGRKLKMKEFPVSIFREKISGPFFSSSSPLSRRVFVVNS